MDVLRVDGVDQAGVGGNTLNLEHLTHFEDALGDSGRVLKVLAKLLGQVVSRQSLEVRQPVVERCRQG